MLLLAVAACGDSEDHTLSPDSGIDQRRAGDWLRCEPVWQSGVFIPYNYGMRILPDGSRQTLGVNWSTGRIEVADQVCPLQPILCSGKGKFRYQTGRDSWRICNCTFDGDRLTIAGMPAPEANTQYYKRVNPPGMFVAPVQYQLRTLIDGASHEAPMVWSEPAVTAYYSGTSLSTGFRRCSTLPARTETTQSSSLAAAATSSAPAPPDNSQARSPSHGSPTADRGNGAAAGRSASAPPIANVCGKSGSGVSMRHGRHRQMYLLKIKQRRTSRVRFALMARCVLGLEQVHRAGRSVADQPAHDNKVSGLVNTVQAERRPPEQPPRENVCCTYEVSPGGCRRTTPHL